MQKLGEHMGLEAGDVYALRLSGLLHDVGKTLELSPHGAQRCRVRGPSRAGEEVLYEPGSPVRGRAACPRPASTDSPHVYERFDGTGFPDRRAGKDIPLAARISGDRRDLRGPHLQRAQPVPQDVDRQGRRRSARPLQRQDLRRQPGRPVPCSRTRRRHAVQPAQRSAAHPAGRRGRRGNHGARAAPGRAGARSRAVPQRRIRPTRSFNRAASTPSFARSSSSPTMGSR